MNIIVGENSPLSEHVKVWAEESREEARGYRDMRNILAVGIAGLTGGLNATESVSSMPSVDQIKFNAAGLAIAAISALGMEMGRRKREKKAESWDAHADELAKLDL